MKPAILDSFHCKSDSQVCISVEEEHEDYVDRVKSGAEMEGSPHGYKFLAFLAALKEMPIGLANQTKMKEMEARFFDMEMFQVETYVAGVYLERMADPDLVRLLIQMQNLDPSDRRLIIDSMKQINCTHLPSQAPAGYMERQIQNCIEQLDGKK